jgi:hypothetical protein
MNRFVTAFALALSLAFAPEAFAGKKGGDEAASADAKKDPYAVPEIKTTKIAEFDAVFEKGRAPVTSLADTRKMVDAAQARMNTALGLGAEVTFDAALTEFEKKVETKGKLAYKKGKMPTFTMADAIPDDMQTMFTEINGAMSDFEKAATQLEGIQGELATLATATAELPGKVPEAAKSAGLKATEIPTATANTKHNTGVIATGKDQAAKLAASLNTIVTTVEANVEVAAE